ncbi:putative cytosol aminopeptidase [Actinoplanes lobatus]|uniref:Probable cytosol aminopeptidase n=1 Tax=Actinoplanes lobatus TaxID=113568 RepID=A0A7W7HL14_9ACTN|nr:leucyl aminopeptidase [Actinoplanes lobatus]MBB4752498.1 leucyl aminopeptidase [Actinoplanes lobatus]GGN99063.1 putative cytosol aminopeptidase [Actinoplanes lobatus]GIE46281.1 putative cytosol aminopeptidase [Actinoplanes lobatus]
MTSLLEKFDPIPSVQQAPTVQVTATPGELASIAGVADVVGLPVGTSGELPVGLKASRSGLAAAGFDGEVGQALMISPADGPPMVLYGVGQPGEVDGAGLRNAAAALARAAEKQVRLAIMLPQSAATTPEDAAQSLVEGALLARYHFGGLKRDNTAKLLGVLTLLAPAETVPAVERGVRRGQVFAAAAALARDLANAPPSLLTATRMAECAQALAHEAGLEVRVYDKDELLAMGCGGLLGVNAGSADPPRMIRLTYRPQAGDAQKLTFVGKGIMYDSGGISLKPADAVHATMKNDMSGAGAILAAMTALRRLDCPTAVTGYLMCTDNMPSGTATKLGDVLHIRGGTTVEVINTDAEGRLVMADALVLATEEPCDAIVDIATLTGACMRALGVQIAGVFGNDQQLIDQVSRAAEAVDEPVWQLPLAHRYRKELNSEIADIKNMGGPNGGAIHAALFLEEFVRGKPWAHIDIAGTAQNEKAAGWQTAGCSGFGARLLIQLACDFTTAR